GIFNTGGNAGGVLAPVITPYVSAAWTWQAGVGLGAVICLAGACLWLWIDPGEAGPAPRPWVSGRGGPQHICEWPFFFRWLLQENGAQLIPPSASRQRREGYDEGELLLEVLHQLVVRGEEGTFLALGQGDVEAVINADAGRRGDGVGPGDEGDGGEQLG